MNGVRMTDYLLDSGILILHLRKQPGYLELMESLAGEEELYVSVISRFETIRGMHDREKKNTFALLDSLKALDVTREIADQAGELVRSWKTRGTTFDNADALIAASALQNGLTLVTTNPKHFPMPELTVLQADESGNLTPYKLV
jgi:predicted nucleic acid-binding protein